jgi:tetratricopeptide (TPR) repeat protein
VTVRDVAYSMLLRRRQRQLHLATARAIAALYPTDEYVELIAYHFARTEEDAEAAQWLERAGDRARDTYANDAAIGHYQDAIKRLEQSGAETVKLAGLEEKLGEVLYQMSRFREAQEVLDRAIKGYRETGELEAAGWATALLGNVLDKQGELEEAKQRLEEMAELLEEGNSFAARARLQAYLASVFQNQRRYADMLRAAERAKELAQAAGDEGLRGGAEERRGAALDNLGRMDESREALEEAIRLLEGVGDLQWLSVAIGNLGWNWERAGDSIEALRLYQRALELFMRTGSVQHLMFTHLNLAALFLTIGEWEQTRKQIEHAGEIGRTHGAAAWVAPWLPLHLGTLALQKREWGRAAEQLYQAAELAEGTSPEVLEYAQASLAKLELLQGKPQEARNRLRGLAAEEGADLPFLLPILAWACLELGEIGRGLELTERAEREARGRGTLLYLPEALRIKGMALRRLGKTEEARKVLNEGLERAQRMPNPYTEARILVELGLLDRQEGIVDQAREQLQEALSIFQRLRARKAIEWTEQALAQLARA